MIKQNRLAPTRIAIGLAAISTLFGLNGCAIGPNYERPVVALPTHYTAAAQANPIEVRTDWWGYFNDPVLNQLIEDALKDNADLAAAIARVKEASGVSQEVNAGFFPQIDADATTARQHTSGRNQTAFNINPAGTDGSTYINRRATMSTSYEVDVWGKLRRTSEAGGALLDASLYARDAVRLSLAATVSNAYLALRSLDAQLEAVRSTTESRATTLKLVKIRVDAGLSSPQDAFQAESTLATAQAQLASLRQQRAATESLLGLLTGKTGLQIPETNSQTTLALPPIPPAGLPSELLAARPDIRQAEATLIAANARIGVAKSAYFPKLSLTGFLGSESRELGDLFRSGAGIWSAGFGLSLPIFDFGRTSARVAQASAQQQQAVATYQKAIQNAFKEVSDALVGIRETGEAASAQATRRDAAHKALDIAQKRYAAGAIGYLELLDNQRSASDADIAWVSSNQNRLTASVDLFKVLGGGWKESKQ